MRDKSHTTLRFTSLLVTISIMVLGSIYYWHSTSTNPSTLEDAAVRHDGLSAWLRLHPPRQASHDAEMLRRRALAALVELEPEELAEHVPAIVASLDHEDSHVRSLAVGMLQRLQPAAVRTHVEILGARLSSSDSDVRFEVLKAIAVSMQDGAAAGEIDAAALAPSLVARLADEEAHVRWAVLDTLALLPADALAAVTLRAVDILMQQRDLSIARAAVSLWAPKLEGHKSVLAALSRLRLESDLKDSGGVGEGGGL